jgi:pyrrolysine biosynthesis protein PylC
VRLLVVGAKLQGAEIAYLAGKAGLEVTMVDRNPAAPARSLGTAFACLDARDSRRILAQLRRVDLVIPAVENRIVLKALAETCAMAGTPLVYDASAYRITCSKKRSNRMLRAQGLPLPLPWPGCGYPVVVKPSAGSGSRGVRVFAAPERPAHSGGTRTKPGAAVQWGNPSGLLRRGRLAEEFIRGRHYSVEVTGRAGCYEAHRITELEMDRLFDCKRVKAPAGLSPRLASELERISITAAASLRLCGIMDVEAICDGCDLRIIEIDARFPSQTPTVVYWSGGVNLVETLVGLFAGGEGAAAPMRDVPGPREAIRGALLEHLRVSPGRLEVCGEHIMASAAELRVQKSFFGAEEAITDYRPGKDRWVGTLIVTGDTLRDAEAARRRVIQRIIQSFGIRVYLDESPEVPAEG